MSDPVNQLVEAATRAAASGSWAEAERLWHEVRKLQPAHPKALFSLGVHAFRRGDLATARDLLKNARAAAPQDLLTALMLGSVYRELGDATSEREAIEAALVIDPYCLPALLAKAAWIERSGKQSAAASMYANALTVASAEKHWPAELRPQLEYARAFVERHSVAYRAYLEEKVASLQAALPAPVAGRWREAAAIMARASKPYYSLCNQLHVPRLPAIPFFERSEFPWAAALEAKTDAIRSELIGLLERERARFSPYIAYNPGEPVNQWRELNHSHRWSAFHLWRSGSPVQENLERCPETARALAALPMADIPRLCPNAMFSALAPKTRIPPHNGETNARVIVHLPLVVPEGCRYRVGFEERRWKVGEILVFDDTIEHEAINDSDELRVVLIFDIWNPLLTAEEREMVRALTSAAREFN